MTSNVNIEELSGGLRAQMREASDRLCERIRQDIGDGKLYEMYADHQP